MKYRSGGFRPAAHRKQAQGLEPAECQGAGERLSQAGAPAAKAG